MVAPEVKKDRLDRLSELQDATSRRKNESLVGNVQDVLVEGPSRTDREVLTARTRSDRLVLVPKVEGAENRFGRAIVTAAQTWMLHGHLERVERGA